MYTSDLVIHGHVHLLFFGFSSLTDYYKIEYSSLHYTVGPCSLSYIYIYKIYIYIYMKLKVAQSCPDFLQPHGLYRPWNSPGQNTGVGSLSLLQGIFPTWGSNPGLLHWRWILYQLSHKGSPGILEWVSFSLLQRIFLAQELNWGLLHCRRILYQMSYIYIHTHTHTHTYIYIYIHISVYVLIPTF